MSARSCGGDGRRDSLDVCDTEGTGGGSTSIHGGLSNGLCESNRKRGTLRNRPTASETFTLTGDLCDGSGIRYKETSLALKAF